jgi:hypothetical protein
MRRLITRFGLFLLLLTQVSSCHKDDESHYIYVDNTLKQCLLFQKGSYWIYLNEENQTLDSSYITIQPLTEWNSITEMISYSVSNSFIQKVLLVGASDLESNSDSFADIVMSYPSEGYYMALTSAYTLGNSTSNWLSAYCHFVEQIDTLFLNNNKFVNVIHTRASVNNRCPYYENYLNDYYFAKNIGLVKYSIQGNSFDSTWSLVRWHVIQ